MKMLPVNYKGKKTITYFLYTLFFFYLYEICKLKSFVQTLKKKRLKIYNNLKNVTKYQIILLETWMHPIRSFQDALNLDPDKRKLQIVR
jgi:hypothetical protein